MDEYIPVSVRVENARKKCKQCANKCGDFTGCKYPVILERTKEYTRMCRLISMSKDGLTCQLFVPKEGKK